MSAENLASYLVDRLNGKRPVMHEIAVRHIPARSLLTLLRYVHADEQIPVGREFLICARPPAVAAKGAYAAISGRTGPGPHRITR